MNDQTSFLRQTFEHFYVGIAITVVYVMVSPLILDRGYPGVAALLFVELFVLTPLVVTHLLWRARGLNNSWSLEGVVRYRTPIGVKSFVVWFVGGLIAILAIYVPLYPVGIFFRVELFWWLPEWYFNPAFGVEDLQLLANLFLIAIVIDGIIAPTLEEVFFRGYLLPRMSYLKGWAPVVNGAFFGIYHFWQPHNLIALIAVGIILSYVVWKTKNVYLGIALHCAINIAGAVGGYFAIINGIDISR